ncbi:hypothetical protein [Microbispora sp. CL1-1]|nr:hypothetical protein [Microbispora sp. CL1-1]NJP27777.1 hypothetical protein [Microbispora sp. CL1-1]
MDGQHLDVLDRMAQIHSRYTPDQLVRRSITVSMPYILPSSTTSRRH